MKKYKIISGQSEYFTELLNKYTGEGYTIIGNMNTHVQGMITYHSVVLEKVIK